jgi:hypothetical protein
VLVRNSPDGYSEVGPLYLPKPVNAVLLKAVLRDGVCTEGLGVPRSPQT